MQASAPERPIDGGMATEALLTHLVVSKYCYHTALYRVGIPVQQFGRHARVQPSREGRATTDWCGPPSRSVRVAKASR